MKRGLTAPMEPGPASFRSRKPPNLFITWSATNSGHVRLSPRGAWMEHDPGAWEHDREPTPTVDRYKAPLYLPASKIPVT